MAKYNNTNIPENKFAEVTIGNNGVRIVQKTKIPVSTTIEKIEERSIYLRAEDIMEIFAKFIAGTRDNDEIETVYLSDEHAVDIGDENSDIIMDASY